MVESLNIKQIKNFNSLDVNCDDILFPKELLINSDLLNCDDYSKRIKAMLKLKNGDGCWHLFDKLCSPNFLNSKRYYEDIEMISKAVTARYALWVINNDLFINSKYHDEDLKLIVFAKDTEKNGEGLDWLVAEALATVAINVDSINSPYHQHDMELIANSGSKCLNRLKELAVDSVSLMDEYHLENMLILAENPVAKDLLYNLMIDFDIIENAFYRDMIRALVKAKSKIKARAIYNYITNLELEKEDYIFSSYMNLGLSYADASLLRGNMRVADNLNPNYLEYLDLLNRIDDKFVLFFEAILSNEFSFKSQYQEYDLNFLLGVTNEGIFKDLFALMTNEYSLDGAYHKEDVELISKTENSKIRELLLEIAMNEDSINSCNHRYDMSYVARLNLDSIKGKWKAMSYYLLDPEGINAEEHIDMLEKLSCGEIVGKTDKVLEYLDSLALQLNEVDNSSEFVVGKNNKSKVLARFGNVFRNKKKKDV